MTEISMYLYKILKQYEAKDVTAHKASIVQLGDMLKKWASSCYVSILVSGSRSKGTAISLASDIDLLVSLTSKCNDTNGGLKGCYDSLFLMLNKHYTARKQNVSVRIELEGLEIDITPARKQNGNTNYHNLYVSKSDSWTQTNIQKHIDDVKRSGRTSEIKILKIWRELHQIDFPSIYLEYLLIDNILLGKSKSEDSLGDNVWYVFNELAKTQNNPLYAKIVDPSNSNNIISDLLTDEEKDAVINQAQIAIIQKNWNQIIW